MQIIANTIQINGRAHDESSGRQEQPETQKLILDQRKVDRAKEILGAATETEAIHRALDEALELARFREETEAGLHALLGRGGFADDFAPSTK